MKTRPMMLETKTRAPFLAQIHAGAAAGRAFRVVGGPQEAVGALREVERLALVPDVVAGRHNVGAGRDRLRERCPR